MERMFDFGGYWLIQLISWGISGGDYAIKVFSEVLPLLIFWCSISNIESILLKFADFKLLFMQLPWCLKLISFNSFAWIKWLQNVWVAVPTSSTFALEICMVTDKILNSGLEHVWCLQFWISNFERSSILSLMVWRLVVTWRFDPVVEFLLRQSVISARVELFWENAAIFPV